MSVHVIILNKKCIENRCNIKTKSIYIPRILQVILKYVLIIVITIILVVKYNIVWRIDTEIKITGGIGYYG